MTDHSPEAMARRCAKAACNAINPRSSDAAHDWPQGHRHGYESCVAPRCSCWSERKRILLAGLDALRPGDRLSSGLVVMPKTPTEKMKEAGDKAMDHYCAIIDCPDDREMIAVGYCAMIEAAGHE